MIFCGKCGKVKCECPQVDIAAAETRHPAEWATGQRLDDLAMKVGISRAGTEIDDTLRSRVQISLINSAPYRSGIPGGLYLERMAQRHGVYRQSGELDPKLLTRLMLTVLQKRMPTERKRRVLPLSAPVREPRLSSAEVEDRGRDIEAPRRLLDESARIHSTSETSSPALGHLFVRSSYL